MQFLIVIILSIICYLIYLKCKKFISKQATLKEPDISTPLPEFKESHKASEIITKKGIPIIKITKLYEEKCIKNPLKYKNDPTIPEIISTYNKIINGEIPDPEGTNIPSEFILNDFNQDYYTYVVNQIKYNSALLKEKIRLEKMFELKDIKLKLFATLINQGVPPLIAKIATDSEKKLNSFSAEDWITFCNKIKLYCQSDNRITVDTFVEIFDEKNILFDEEKFELFGILTKNKIPINIIKDIILEKISIDQAQRASKLIEKFGLSYQQAIKEILRIDSSNKEADKLRTKYKNLLKGDNKKCLSSYH